MDRCKILSYARDVARIYGNLEVPVDMRGIFYGIGVGPGDPELLTVKAIRAMEKVDVLIAPKTEKKDGSVALSILRGFCEWDGKL